MVAVVTAVDNGFTEDLASTSIRYPMTVVLVEVVAQPIIVQKESKLLKSMFSLEKKHCRSWYLVI